eukprot:UN00139
MRTTRRIEKIEAKIEEMRQAFSLPADAFFCKDHTYLAKTEQPDVWRLGVTSYLKAGMAHVYKIEMSSSVGEHLNYMSDALNIEFDHVNEQRGAFNDVHIVCPPLVSCNLHRINWELIKAPRKFLQDSDSSEWLYEIWRNGDPGMEAAIVDGKIYHFKLFTI